MRNITFVLLLAAISGCAWGYRISHVHGTIKGTNVQTPYGPANGDLQYDATTCFGNCPKAEVTINADHGPQVNTAI